MNNQVSTGDNTSKEWYKKWWGVIIALLIWPLFSVWYIAKKTEWSLARKCFAIVGVIVLANVVYGGEKPKETTVKQSDVSVMQQQNEMPAQEIVEKPLEDAKVEEVKPAAEITKPDETRLPKYEIVYELKGKRYDGGVNYYVLIDPVNLANDGFKNDVQAITKQIVKDKGSKISIDFLDDKSVLELEYKSHYGANTLGRILTKPEMDKQGLHLVATFSGELAADIYPNSLAFFPSTFTDNPKVGKYVESMEFNPSQNQ